MPALSDSESKLPFAQTKIVEFWNILVQCSNECGDYGYVTLPSLSKNLPSEYHGLKDPSSELTRFLSSKAFRHRANQQDDPSVRIQFDYLALFALLQC